MTLRHALLGLLDDEPASGYDLIKVFNSSMANVWPATQSQVYTELKRMADDELIIVSAAGARGRKDYEITDAGRAELRHWLRHPPKPKAHRSDLLLRVFFLNLVSPDDAREVFTSHRANVAAQKKQLDAIVEEIADNDDTISINGRIALEFGLRKADMEIGWADWALERLRT